MAAERHEDTGLIVVGASLGGLVTAITAADHGHRVILVERSKELGGLAGTESETLPAADTRFQRVADVKDSLDRFLADVDAMRPETPPDVIRAIAGQSAALVEWLADRCGAQVSLQSRTATGGHGVARLHSVGDTGGAGLIAVLARAASHHTHIKVRLATEAERLLTDDAGAVLGVKLRPDRRGATVLHGPVVLACGGFAAEDEMVARHCPSVAGLPYLGGAGAKGDALRLAEPAGAATRSLGAVGVTALLAEPSHLALPYEIVSRGGILVNQLGQRFTDESAAALPLATAVRGQPGKLAYLVFDERIAQAIVAHDPFFARVVLPKTSRRGSTPKHLAKQLSLPEESLTRLLETYNDGVAKQSDAFGRRALPAPLAEPYYGVRVTGARRITRGGIAIDVEARALTAAGTPVPGLFAVGGAAASISRDGTETGCAGIDALAALGSARLAALALGQVVDES